MVKLIDINDYSMFEGLSEFLHQGDICDEELGSCSANPEDTIFSDGFLSSDEVLAVWGDLPSFQTELHQRFSLFANFAQGALVSSEPFFDFFLSDFPKIPYPLWKVIENAPGRDSIKGDGWGDTLALSHRIRLENFALRPWSNKECVRELRTELRRRMDDETYFAYYEGFEEMVRVASERMGLTYVLPRATDLPQKEFLISVRELQSQLEREEGDTDGVMLLVADSKSGDLFILNFDRGRAEGLLRAYLDQKNLLRNKTPDPQAVIPLTISKAYLGDRQNIPMIFPEYLIAQGASLPDIYEYKSSKLLEEGWLGVRALGVSVYDIEREYKLSCVSDGTEAIMLFAIALLAVGYFSKRAGKNKPRMASARSAMPRTGYASGDFFDWVGTHGARVSPELAFAAVRPVLEALNAPARSDGTPNWNIGFTVGPTRIEPIVPITGFQASSRDVVSAPNLGSTEGLGTRAGKQGAPWISAETFARPKESIQPDTAGGPLNNPAYLLPPTQPNSTAETLPNLLAPQPLLPMILPGASHPTEIKAPSADFSSDANGESIGDPKLGDGHWVVLPGSEEPRHIIGDPEPSPNQVLYAESQDEEYLEIIQGRFYGGKKKKLKKPEEREAALKRLSAEGLPEGLWFFIKMLGSKQGSTTISLEDPGKPGKNYTHFSLRVREGRLFCEKIESYGVSDTDLRKALFENEGVTLSGSETDKYYRDRIEERFYTGFERGQTGRYLTLRTPGDRAKALKNLSAKDLPEGFVFFIKMERDGSATILLKDPGEPNVNYTHFSFRVREGRLFCEKIESYGVSDTDLRKALFENEGVTLSGSERDKYYRDRIEERFYTGFEKGKTGQYPKLKTPGDRARALKNLSAEGLPEDLEFFIKMNEYGSTTILLKDPGEPNVNYTHFSLRVQEGRLFCEKIESYGVSDTDLRKALFENEGVTLSGSERDKYYRDRIEERFYTGFEKNKAGQYPRLRTPGDRARALKNLSAEGLPEGFVFFIKMGRDGSTTILLKDPGGPSRDYTHFAFRVEKGVLVVDNLVGSIASRYYEFLRTNTDFEFSPFLWVRYKHPAREEKLLLRLSEFGRQEILERTREGQVDEKTITRVARDLLLEYAGAYQSSPDWDVHDPRFAVAVELNRYLMGQEFEEGEAEIISSLIQAAMEREVTRQLEERTRVRRQTGSAPISERGWDDVFSDELREGLRAFAAEFYGDVVPGEDLSRAYLRDPFNEMLGAYYWHLMQAGETAQRFEILSHLWEQRHRRDSLTEFYGGMAIASGRSDSDISSRMQNEFRLFEENRTQWHVNPESPFRISEGGIVGGAAHFLWHGVFDADMHEVMREGARRVFPSFASEITDDTDLSEILPQALFFEVVGSLASTLLGQWESQSQDQRNYAQGIELLELMLGLGDESVMGFRFGFGDTDVRELLNNLCRELIRLDGDGFRRYLEGTWSYSRNIVSDGRYTQETTSVRRGDMIEALLLGYSLRDASSMLRNFRHGGLTPEQEIEWLNVIDETLLREEELQPFLEEFLSGILDLYTSDRDVEPGKTNPTDRWYLFEQWLYSGDAEAYRARDGRLFDAVESESL